MISDIKEVGRRVIREVWDERSLCGINLKVLFLDYGGGRQEEARGNGWRDEPAPTELSLRISAAIGRKPLRSLRFRRHWTSLYYFAIYNYLEMKIFLILRSSKLRL